MFSNTQVTRKIVWPLRGLTKDKVERYIVGAKLESESTKVVFGNNITEWSLRVYFAGRAQKDGEVDSAIFLCLNRASSKVFKINYTLGIVCRNGNKEVQYDMSGESFKCTSRGAVITREGLIDSKQGYLIDGKLTIYCHLTITAARSTQPFKDDSMKINLLNNLKRTMDEELFTDFKIETSTNQVIKVHRCILAASSPFFYAMLATKMKENESNVAKLTEEYAVIKEVMRFIYTGEVEDLSTMANELVFAAEKYQLDDLKQMCIAHIEQTLCTENVLQSLIAADYLTNSETLKANCIEAITRNLKFLSTTADWKKLTPRLLTEILCQMNDESHDTTYV